jgi:dTDP-6-deoxy-L-talose 4-dehydrogenase (NAD+)
MKQKVLVTGASGFIGNYVVQRLLQMNCSVIATSANEQKAKQYEWFESVRYIPFDFSEISEVVDYYNFFEKPDRLIHLAWEGLPNYKSLFHIEENLPRHFTFLKNLIGGGLPDLTITGTCLEYGLQEGTLSEDMPCFPSNPYAIAKDSLRKFVEELTKTRPINFKWIRLFYLYGKGQNPNSLLSQLDKAVKAGEALFNMSGGEQVRDYLPVEEVAFIIATSALQESVTGIINCCSGEPVSIRKFVEDYCKENKISIKLNLGYYPYTDYEPMRFWGDTQKLKDMMEAARVNQQLKSI